MEKQEQTEITANWSFRQEINVLLLDTLFLEGGK